MLSPGNYKSASVGFFDTLQIMPCLSTIREDEGINLFEELLGRSQQPAQAIWDLSLTQAWLTLSSHSD